MEDLEDFYRYARGEEVGRMAGWPPHEDREVSRGILADFIREKKVFALQYREKMCIRDRVERDTSNSSYRSTARTPVMDTSLRSFSTTVWGRASHSFSCMILHLPSCFMGMQRGLGICKKRRPGTGQRTKNGWAGRKKGPANAFGSTRLAG